MTCAILTRAAERRPPQAVGGRPLPQGRAFRPPPLEMRRSPPPPMLRVSPSAARVRIRARAPSDSSHARKRGPRLVGPLCLAESPRPASTSGVRPFGQCDGRIERARHTPGLPNRQKSIKFKSSGCSMNVAKIIFYRAPTCVDIRRDRAVT